MCIKGRACKVISVTTSKTGKHGHAKCHFTAQDIFNGKKCEELIPSTHAADIPFVVRKDFSLLDISDDDFLTLCDEAGETRADVGMPSYPDGFAHEIREKFADEEKTWTVTLQTAMGIEMIIAIKEDVAAAK